MTPTPTATFRPEPDIELEMPPLLRTRIAHAVRDLRDGIAFIIAAYRKQRLSGIELKMLTNALNDGHLGGHTAEDASFTWEAPVYLPAALGKSLRTREPRRYTAYVQKRGPLFHNTRQA